MPRIPLFALLLTLSLGHPIVSFAQFGGSNSGGGGGQSGGGLGGASGQFGSGSSFGGSGGGGGGGLGGGMGGGGGGGLGGGLGGGMGGGGLGGGLGGAGGMGGGTGGQSGQQQGQGFLGRNTNTNQFLGRNTQGQGQGLGGLQGGNNGGNRRGNGNGNQNLANLMNGQQQGGPTNARGAAGQLPPIRPRQKVNFVYTKPQLAMVSVKLETRLNKMSTIKGFTTGNVKGNTLNLSVEPSGELVMKGTVASASDAKLAENLARLEPGVYSVRNELTYPSADAEE